MKGRTVPDPMIAMPRPVITAYPLLPGRVHEVSGPGAVAFVLRAARQAGADLLWVRESWQADMLHPLGFGGFDPARLVMAMTGDQKDTLAVAEEALRDGAVAMVALEITAPLSLTAGRRLQHRSTAPLQGGEDFRYQGVDGQQVGHRAKRR